MKVEFCLAHGMENGKTMMEILSMDALDHHPGLAQPRLQNLYSSWNYIFHVVLLVLWPADFWSWKVKIIKQFMETGEPVKYGQCWVFSGLLTTLMRSIGIPARSVTNFASAHDTENTMTIDKFIRPV